MAGDKKLTFYWTVFCRNLLAESYTRSENCIGEFEKENKEIEVYFVLTTDSRSFNLPTPTNFLAQYSSKISLIITPPLVEA